MADLSCPLLRPDASARIVGQCVEIEIEDQIYTVTGVPLGPLHHAISSMNGHLQPSELARLSSLSEQEVKLLIKQLSNRGAITCLGLQPSAEVSPDEFAQLCRRVNESWKQRLFAHPLWRGLADGTLPRQVFVGWVIESMWFIEGVIDRLPMAVACAEDRAVRSIFSQHFSEEWDHFRFFTHALDTLGIDAEQRGVAQPLPATRAVQHWMRAAARRDVLRYAVCSGFLESTGKDRIAAREFFRQLGEQYDSNGGGAVRPMAAHVALDEQYGHGGFVEKVLAHAGRIDSERARLCLQSVFGLVETLEMWSTDILMHYQDTLALPLGPQRSYRRRWQ